MKEIKKLQLTPQQLLSCEQQENIVAGFVETVTTREEDCHCSYGQHHLFYVCYSFTRTKEQEDRYEELCLSLSAPNTPDKLAEIFEEMLELEPPKSYEHEYKIYHGWTEILVKGEHRGWIKGAGDYSVVPDGLAGNRYNPY